MFGNFADGHFPLTEIFEGVLEADPVDIIEKTHVHFPVKTGAEIVRVHAGDGGEFGQSQFFPVIAADILEQFDGPGHGGLFLGFHDDAQERSDQQPQESVIFIIVDLALLILTFDFDETVEHIEK